MVFSNEVCSFFYCDEFANFIVESRIPAVHAELIERALVPKKIRFLNHFHLQ